MLLMHKKFAGFSLVLILFAIGFVAFLFGLWRFVNRENKDISNNSGISEISEDNPKPSPVPFYEMTIPYLRERVYKSEIAEMRETNSNSNYTTYFAAYDSDGFKVNGMLTRPTGETPIGGWPAIVFVHGYIPPGQYQTMSNYNSYVDYLAKAGFVVFKIDLRGHAQSEGEAHGAYYSGDYVVDTLNAKAALESLDFVKRGAVGLWGHSMAGNVVFRSLVASGDIDAAVIWAGAVYTYQDWEFGINDNSYRPPDDNSERARRRRELFNTHGDFDPKSDFWKMVPATNYLEGVDGAVQIHHAVDDNVVPIDYSRNLVSIIGNTSISHQMFDYPNGGHNLTGSSFNLAMQRSVEFFRQNLK